MNFSFYRADSDYCDYLRTYDPRVPYTMDVKTTRPFIGILVRVDKINFYAPLTSPKPKHKTMKTQLDFIKINNGNWGAINLNNMIPISETALIPIQISHLPTETSSEKVYRDLLANQLSWCNRTVNRKSILQKAERLYHLVTSG